MDPAPISEKDKMANDIKKECQTILEKYFEKREYDKEKVEKWKNYALKEVYDYLENTYNDFGFIISIIIIKLGHIRTNQRIICRNNTDDFLFTSVLSNTMYIEIRISFYKIYSSNISLLDIIDEDTILEMNNILKNHLEGKKYSYDIAENNATNIAEKLNDYLFEKKFETRPCSTEICYILQEPIEFKFNYKIIRLKYIPLMVSYSNDSLYSLLILFVLDN